MAAVTPKQFYIFGNGISFSISPTIHNAGFQHDHLPHHYSIHEIESVDSLAPLVRAPEFGGASVTMPHKLLIHTLCDRLTDTAKLIGAVNTLIVDESAGTRALVGDNTDWSGLWGLLTGYAQRTSHTFSVGLVIGAGGASRAAVYALHRAGAKTIYIANRTRATAEAVRDSFASVFPVEIVDIDALPSAPDVVIGTTPADKTTEAQFERIFSTKAGLCIDMAYKPRKTPLLAVAQRHAGWETATGLQVLLMQAFDQYLLWTGREAPKQAMVDAVAAREGEDVGLIL